MEESRGRALVGLVVRPDHLLALEALQLSLLSSTSSSSSPSLRKISRQRKFCCSSLYDTRSMEKTKAISGSR